MLPFSFLVSSLKPFVMYSLTHYSLNIHLLLSFPCYRQHSLVSDTSPQVIDLLMIREVARTISCSNLFLASKFLKRFFSLHVLLFFLTFFGIKKMVPTSISLEKKILILFELSGFLLFLLPWMS